jgi:hypothetical protein
VKIKCLTIQGFRGFNEERTINVNDRLTIIYAPNSCGKTSVSEALEWLLYQVTSKVEKADSKDEYKGCYRNRHLPESKTPFVKARLSDNSNEIVFTCELNKDDTAKLLVGEDGDMTEVNHWPFPHDVSSYPRPFILQHALKYLLLTKPDDRFQGFAQILGLEALDGIQRDVISLCTAPDRKIPPEVKILQNKVSTLETRLAERSELQTIYKALKRKDVTFETVSDTLNKECIKKVPGYTKDEPILPQLLKIREDTVGKVFKGRIILSDYTDPEKYQNSDDVVFFLAFITGRFIEEYTGLIALANLSQIIKQADFFKLGSELWKSIPQVCPFCDTTLDEEVTKHIVEKHGKIQRQASISEALVTQKIKVSDSLKSLNDRLITYHTRQIVKVQTLLDLVDSLEELKAILVPKNEAYFQKLNSIISDIRTYKEKIESAYQIVGEAFSAVINSIDTATENSDLIKSLGDGLVTYVSETNSYSKFISSSVGDVGIIDQVLKHELDILAGTEDVTLLIDLHDNLSAINKKLEVDRILGSLKDLRGSVDKFVAERMLSAITGELTSGVMEWYNQIKTTTDPDVHFDGFDMDRNQKGEVKARRVKIKAKSYDQELVSAVSSLSESKLNALGLCVSIATCLKGESVFDFLIIDDPIQSLDTEHEAQFVAIIRNLVEKYGKQVVLLSHNRPWLDQVKAGCRSLNGWFYEFTGFTQIGPHISIVEWEKWRERLKGVKAIIEDPTADSIKLQQAEEEIRLAIADISSELYNKIKGVRKSPHDLNSTKVKNILTECGVETNLVDRIGQTFCTTDDSHHSAETYSPTRDRIKKYHSWTHELTKYLV